MRRLVAFPLVIGVFTLALSIMPPVEAASGQVVVPNCSPVQIAVVLDHSGSVAAFGASARNAVQMAVDKHPRIKGFKVQLNDFDGPCGQPTPKFDPPSLNAAVAKQVVANPQNVAVIGHMCSVGDQAALPIYEQAGVVALSGSATNPANPTFGADVFNSVAVPDSVSGIPGAFDNWYAIVQTLPSDIRWRMKYQQEFGSPPGQYADLYFDAASLMLDEIAATADVKDRNLVIDRASLAGAIRSEHSFKGVTCSITLDNRGYRVNDPESLGECAEISRAAFSLDEGAWQANVTGLGGPTLTSSDGRVEITIPAGAAADPIQGFINVGQASRCQLRGDYDVQVSFALLEWPDFNGVHVLLGDLDFVTGHSIERGATGGPGPGGYAAFFAPKNGAATPTTDLSGSLRLVRTSGTVQAMYLHDNHWVVLLSGPGSTLDTGFQITALAFAKDFQHQLVKVEFSRFKVSRGQVICPLGVAIDG